MNPTLNPHPGRSVDFLSRLHDGDLDPGERARFEAHRARCAECRRAAIEFEDALSLFRSARSTPPRSDLAARILRKVQSANRVRRPFGARFRIDLAWTALLLTALLAVIITTPIAVRRSEPPPPVRVSVAAAPPPRAQEEHTRTDSLQVPRVNSKSTGVVARRSVAPPRSKDANVAEPSAGPREAREPDVGASITVSGEAPLIAAGGAGRSEEEAKAGLPALPQKTSKPARLFIEAIDGFGPAPDQLGRDRFDLSSAFRGEQYVLTVDSQGSVREVRPHPTRGSARGRAELRARAPETLSDESAASAALRTIRFRPGNRPRLLLVRFE
jgi:hypothetical protein